MINQISNFEPADEIVKGSGFRGRNEKDITYGEWCEREARRIRCKCIWAGVMTRPTDNAVAVVTASTKDELDMALGRKAK